MNKLLYLEKGNWVYVIDPKPNNIKNATAYVAVKSKSRYSLEEEIVVYNDEYEIKCPIEDAIPVSITAKILEHIGFEFKRHTFYGKKDIPPQEGWHLGSFSLWKSKNNEYYLYFGDKKLYINYVHQLQNIFPINGMKSDFDLPEASKTAYILK